MKIRLIFLILLSALCITSITAQKSNKKISISGLVTDKQKESIAGALIFVDGKNTNSVTNNKGIYKVRIRPDADSITIVSFNNGISSAVINGRTKIDFILTGSISSQQYFMQKPSNDEVVDIGYGNVKQDNLVTSVSKIDGKNGKYASYKDIYEILKGTSGVIVNGHSIQIHGLATMNLSTQPLLIVDGASVVSFDGIAPYMVESITVLKGPSASIYGSRGANGVILITLIKAVEMK